MAKLLRQLKELVQLKKRRQVEILAKASHDLLLILAKNLLGNLLRDEHRDWLKAREVVLKAKSEEVKKHHLLARENMLKRRMRQEISSSNP